jgi:hypothetical protein
MSEPAGERLSLWRDELEFSASWRHWRHRVPVDGLSLWRDELEFSASWRHRWMIHVRESAFRFGWIRIGCFLASLPR